METDTSCVESVVQSTAAVFLCFFLSRRSSTVASSLYKYNLQWRCLGSAARNGMALLLRMNSVAACRSAALPICSIPLPQLLCTMNTVHRDDDEPRDCFLLKFTYEAGNIPTRKNAVARYTDLVDTHSMFSVAQSTCSGNVTGWQTTFGVWTTGV